MATCSDLARAGMLALAGLAVAAPASAAPVTCRTEAAWRLGETGLEPQAADFYGLRAAGTLTLDAEAGSLAAEGGPMPVALIHPADPATGADLVLASPDGALTFRLRETVPGRPFWLIDLTDLYVGHCEG